MATPSARVEAIRVFGDVAKGEKQAFAGLTEVTIRLPDTGVSVHTYVRVGEPGHPVLVLLHGYPQTFRYSTHHLPKSLSIFIPDIPGYGLSAKSAPTTDLDAYTKSSIGSDLLSALSAWLPSSSSPTPLILAGHDRGARIAHRLAVLPFVPSLSPFKLLAIFLADIVPTSTQFRSLGTPRNAASTFHWAFLAGKYPIPESMIRAYGPGKWCREMIASWQGTPGLDEETMRVYEKAFEKEGVVEATTADYRSAVEEDVKGKVGKEIEVGLVFSEKYLGGRYDVVKEWDDWVERKDEVWARAISGGAGHFLFEEKEEEAFGALREWLVERRLGMISD